MSVGLLPIGNDAPYVDSNGDPLSGGKLYFYAAGSSTPQDTFTTSAGSVANANPVILNSAGYPSSSGSLVQIWGTDGLTYKAVLATSADVVLWTRDNIEVINDTAVSVDQWSASGLTPTYISATSFSLVGDQTTEFQVGRRLKTTNSGGTVYSRISASAFGAVTTVTVVNDSGTLDAGLSAVSYGLLSATNPSTPVLTDAYPVVSGSADKTKLVRLEADNLTTATTRVLTVPDFDQWIGANYSEMNARLTLTSGTPVTTGDVTAAETVYYTPFRGNRIWLYNGTLWQPYVLTELSVDVPDATQMNDVFVYDNAGTLTLDVVAWTNDTTRATALTTQNGIYVKTGATGRRYVGSFYSTTAGNGQTTDSLANRHLWNYYNRVPRRLARFETTASWTYTTATIRQANGATANQVEVVRGVDEDVVDVSLQVYSTNTNANFVSVQAGIGLNTTSAFTAGATGNAAPRTDTGWDAIARLVSLPGIGRHYYSWNEYSTALGTTTWYGDSKYGLQGVTWA